jgi:hypothetical protein
MASKIKAAVVIAVIAGCFGGSAAIAAITPAASADTWTSQHRAVVADTWGGHHVTPGMVSWG